MRADTIGEPGWAYGVDVWLDAAEQAFLRADFALVRPLVRRIEHESDISADPDYAVPYAALRGALAARVGNWTEAGRWCPDRCDLQLAETGVVHALALGALRRLGEDEGHTDFCTAALAIMLWAYLLDEGSGNFRWLLDARRGKPVAGDLWDEARTRLIKRITDLLHALDARSGRDALASWETTWEAERVASVVIPSEAGPHGLIPLGHAARHLVEHGRGAALLDACTSRNPDLDLWIAGSPRHRACAGSVARALSERGQDRVRAAEWRDALTDFGAAVQLGFTLGHGERQAVGRAGRNVGRTLHGPGYSPITRIEGLERAHALLPENHALAAELAAELVRQGWKVFDSDPRQSENRFTRALVISPGDDGARSGLDDHLRLNLCRAIDGPRPKLRVREVQGLLRRDPDCALAQRWLRDHYADSAVAAVMGGDTPRARPAVVKMLHHDDHDGLWDEEFVDLALVDLLIDTARSVVAKDERAGMERRTELLKAAADIAGREDLAVTEEFNTAVLRLAEHLDATGTPSDIIKMFRRGWMQIGVSVRFDRIVETAYLFRAKVREEWGDHDGARHDRACALRIAGETPDAGPLFDIDPGWSDNDDDTGPEGLF